MESVWFDDLRHTYIYQDATVPSLEGVGHGLMGLVSTANIILLHL